MRPMHWYIDECDINRVVLRHHATPGEVEVTRTDEGIIVDIRPDKGFEAVASAQALTDELRAPKQVVYDFCFEVGENKHDPATAAELRQAIQARLDSLEDDELMEAVGVVDVTEDEQ